MDDRPSQLDLITASPARWFLLRKERARPHKKSAARGGSEAGQECVQARLELGGR
jgi:hypothetical protein